MGQIGGVRIAGTGSFLPGAPLSNEALCDRYDLPVTAAWIREWTGLTSRHRAGPDDSAATMATEAGRRAIESSGLAPAEVRRLILCSSLGGDRPLPGTGFVVQAALGLSAADVVDVHGGCVAWMTGLDLAARGVATGVGPTLVIAAERSHGVLDPRDRRTFPLFGEGAAGVLLMPSEDGGMIGSRFFADGNHWRYLWAPGSADPEVAEGAAVRFGIGGRDIRRLLPEVLKSVVDPALQSAGLRVDEIDRLIPHQPNAAWMPELITLLGGDPAAVDVFVGETGSIPTVMVPMGLDRAFRSATPPRAGDRLLLVAVGAGIAAGAIVWEVA